jgi:glycosyltransferase involved in cell wall biosynthesis
MVRQYIEDKSKLDVRQKFNIWRKKFFYKFATHIIAPSFSAKQDMMEYYSVKAEKIHVFPNALFDHHKLNNAKSKEVIGFVGRLHRSKGADILIEAFGILHKEMPSIKLQIVGNGNELKNLEKQVDVLGLKDAVEFKGALANDLVIDFLTSISCLVVPSRWDNQPTTVIEALSTATPVIANNAGGISEIINHEETG